MEYRIETYGGMNKYTESYIFLYKINKLLSKLLLFFYEKLCRKLLLFGWVKYTS